MYLEIETYLNEAYPKELKGFNFYQISKRLEELSDDLIKTFEYNCECIAFLLMPQHS